MGTQAEAEQAIKTFNGSTLDNREIKVNPARPKEETGRGGYGSNRSGSGHGQGSGSSSGRDKRPSGPRRY